MPKLKKIIFPLLLILITVLICFLNYTPGTFLTGWDTLHPEFNFALNFKRILSVWHQEQGLGAIPGHSQMADLPRVFILWLFHFIFPLNFLRYSYIFLCLIIGPLGIYFLIKYLFNKKEFAFIGGLFYLFNLSTLQQFYVPFEMFPTQFAFLPWIILFTLKFLSRPTTFNLINFSLLTLLATPQAYAAHLWYTFFFIYLAFLTFYLILHFNKTNLKKITLLVVLTLAINSFWLLPNIYFITTRSETIKNSATNHLNSEEYLLKNRETGLIIDTGLNKGFYFNWDIYNFSTHQFENLMEPWQKHISKSSVQIIGYLIFFFAINGLILSFIFKNKILISLSPFFIIPLILLLNNTRPFNFIFDFFLQLPLFKEAFRFIFTKISILFLLGSIIFTTFFIFSIFQLIKNKIVICISSIFIIITLFFYAYPFFNSQLISPKIKITIPTEYFKFWQFMSTQPNGRVLSLPLYNYSGWQYYNWGYQGSGFIWFGLKQAILDRDFDRWESKNEESYREFFNSLYSNNPNSFTSTLFKYDINYIIWDQNIISTASKNALKRYLDESRYNSKTKNVFVTKTGRILLARNIRSLLNRYFDKADIKGIKVNDLRNTFIAFQLKSGVPIDVVSQVVGHKRISTTEKYLELIESKEESKGIKLKEL